MSDWIDHDGKGPPDLPSDMVVEMRFRDGGTLEFVWDAFHDHDLTDSNWVHHADPADIVAYRVLPHE